MFRDDIDGLLVWVAKEGDPAIILEADNDKYWVRLVNTDGDIVTQTRYDSVKQALHAFAELMP
jgi:hypothetical protein